MLERPLSISAGDDLTRQTLIGRFVSANVLGAVAQVVERTPAEPDGVHLGHGLDALELFCKTDPDVVTMDITMPHMDGIECVERIVAIKPNILILVISALADKATAVEAMEKGANGFLNKPFSDRQLNDALEELLGNA